MKNKSILSVLMVLYITGLFLSCDNIIDDDSDNESELKSEKSITIFNFIESDATGVIDDAEGSITVVVPGGTELTTLKASFITTGIRVDVNDVEQISGKTENDFSNPVTYTVTAEDGTTKEYVVIVNHALNSAKAITSFRIVELGLDGNINESNKTISLTVPFGTEVTELTAFFTITGKSVNVDENVQANGITVNNFSNPVTYTVIAEDGTEQNYIVTITVLLNPSKDITSFGFSDYEASVSITGPYIAVTLPYGTNISGLKANFTVTGASVKVGDTDQISDVTVNDFTEPVTYTVIAEDGTTKNYIVRVTNNEEQLNGLDIQKRELINVDGGTFNQTSKVYISNWEVYEFEHTISNYKIGKYEVTYELWYVVYTWALSQEYNFQNAGKEGNLGVIGAAPSIRKYEPVSNISWRDIIVWCNAYSDMAGLTPVYRNSDNLVIMDSRNTNAVEVNEAVVLWDANGYRLPTDGEWQFAARFIDGTSWLPYNKVSGDSISGSTLSDYAWYKRNSNTESVLKTHDVGTKLPNALGIYDMSGNVFEWCWDLKNIYPTTAQIDYRGGISGTQRMVGGGAYSHDSQFLASGQRSSAVTETKYPHWGFRIGRSF